MGDIFISYAHEDKDKARALADLFARRGWSVWFDPQIPVGKSYDQVIAEALGAARAVVVLWSRDSVASNWVKAEAQEGADRQIMLPASLDGAKLPLGFRRYQTADLSGWDGTAATEQDAELTRLLTSVAAILDQPLAPDAPTTGRLVGDAAPVAAPKAADDDDDETSVPVARGVEVDGGGKDEGRRVPMPARIADVVTPPRPARRPWWLAGGLALALLAALLAWGASRYSRSQPPDNGGVSRNNVVNGSDGGHADGTKAPASDRRGQASQLTARGVDELENGNPEGASLVFSEAVRMQPDYEMAYLYRGLALSREGNLVGARADFNKVLSLVSADEETKQKARQYLQDVEPRPAVAGVAGRAIVLSRSAASSDALRARLIKDMFSPDRDARIAATTTLIREWKQDPQVVPLAVAAALADPGNKSGVINVLVLLEGMDYQSLLANRAEIVRLLDAVEGNGGQTAAHVKTLRLRPGIGFAVGSPSRAATQPATP